MKCLFCPLIHLLYYISDKINLKIKDHLNYHLDPSKSLNYLFNFANKHHVWSVGIDHIYFSLKETTKKFLFCQFNNLYLLAWAIIIPMSISSQFLYSLIDHPKLPQQFKETLLSGTLYCVAVSSMATAILYAEYKNNLKQFKFIYYLRENWKSKHKLNDKNYQKLRYLILLFTSFVLKLIVPITIISCWIVILLICFMTKLISWMLITPFGYYLLYAEVTSLASSGCLIIITIFYYKFSFDQIARELESISKSRLFTKMSRSLLCKCIYEHYNLSNQIHKLNSMLNRATFGFFTSFCAVQMLMLNIIIKQTNLYMQIVFINVLFFTILGCLGVRYLFSMQIDSAHKLYKTLFSILAKHKVNIRLKLKVNYLKL